MNEEEHPESLLATTPRRVEGHELQSGRKMHIEITGHEECPGRQEYRKERSANGIMSIVLGIMSVKCLCYFKVEESKNTHQSRLQKRVLYRKFLRTITSPGNRHRLNMSEENPIGGVGGNPELG